MEWLIAAATVTALVALVPLLTWAVTGSWRHALEALRQYVGIGFWAFVIVGGFALVVTLVGLIESR